MEYLLTPLEDHLDFGFGITVETYYNAAEYINKGKDEIQSI